MQIALPIHLKAKPTPVYPLSPWTVFNSICKKVKKEDERGGKETTVPHTSCYVFLRTWFLREVCFSLGSPEITPSLPCLLNTVRPFQRRINRGFFFFSILSSFPNNKICKDTQCWSPQGIFTAGGRQLCTLQSARGSWLFLKNLYFPVYPLHILYRSPPAHTTTPESKDSCCRSNALQARAKIGYLIPTKF